MGSSLTTALTSLDVGTLFFVAICVTLLLGVFLLHAWLQDGSRALGWWSIAYLIGGMSGALWRSGSAVVPALPASTSTVLLFAAVGMIWSGARSFHGRPVHWPGMAFGSVFWIAASFFPAFAASASSRFLVSGLIVAGYSTLTAAELGRERRKSLIRRWPAAFAPLLHGAVFLFPAAVATFCRGNAAGQYAARGWIAVFAIEILLYVVGTALFILSLAKDNAVHRYKMAAATDPLTTLLNRRGFHEAAAGLMVASTRRRMAPVSILAFDLDKFKSVNDTYGHAGGDAVLKMFAKVARDTLRATDIVGRLGGEEFVALLPSKAADAAIAAERVRAALAAASVVHEGQRIAVTVSIGVASGPPTAMIDTLITRADEVLYRAKQNGRNRVEIADDVVEVPPAASDTESAVPSWKLWQNDWLWRKEKGAATSGAPENCIA
jgi:diguanylate cyclase (GGDEF)-like protein